MIFVSKLDKLFNVKELVFNLPPGFGKYRRFFSE